MSKPIDSSLKAHEEPIFQSIRKRLLRWKSQLPLRPANQPHKGVTCNEEIIAELLQQVPGLMENELHFSFTHMSIVIPPEGSQGMGWVPQAFWKEEHEAPERTAWRRRATGAPTTRIETDSTYLSSWFPQSSDHIQDTDVDVDIAEESWLQSFPCFSPLPPFW